MILSKVERKLKKRQKTLTKAWYRIITYAIAKAIKSGYLKQNEEWYKFIPTYPKSPSIDLGRDSKNEIDLLRISANTLTNILGKNGEVFEDTVTKRVSEVKRIMDECEKQGVPFELVYNMQQSSQVGAVSNLVEDEIGTENNTNETGTPNTEVDGEPV
jgi:hypothetical protein